MRKKLFSFLLLFCFFFSYLSPFFLAASNTFAADAWTQEKAIHLARKALFGATKEIAEKLYQAGSAQAAVDILFPSIEGPDNTDFKSKLNTLASSEIFNPTNASMYEYYIANKLLDPYEAKAKLFLIFEDTFASSYAGGSLSFLDIQQNHDLLYSHTLGNYKEMVKRNLYNNGETGDYALGKFLDLFNQSNPKYPNENYARELLQLFLMLEYIPTESQDQGSVRNYSEEDVQALAKILFGFKVNESTHQVSYDISANTNSSELFLSGNIKDGKSYPFYNESTGKVDIQMLKTPINGNNGLPDNIIDYIFSKRDYEISMFLAEKLYRFYVGENPTRENLDEISDEILKNDFEIYPSVKWLLASDMMYAPESMETDIYKNPMELTLGLMKILGVSLDAISERYITSEIGWEPYSPGSIFGRDGFDINSNFFTAYTATRWSGIASKISNSVHIDSLFPLSTTLELSESGSIFGSEWYKKDSLAISSLSSSGMIEINNVKITTLSGSQIQFLGGFLDLAHKSIVGLNSPLVPAQEKIFEESTGGNIEDSLSTLSSMEEESLQESSVQEASSGEETSSMQEISETPAPVQETLQEEASEGEASQETSGEETPSTQETSETSAPVQETSQEEASEGEASQETSGEETSSMQETSETPAPVQETPQEESSEGESSQETSGEETSSMQETSETPAPVQETPQEEASQETSGTGAQNETSSGETFPEENAEQEKPTEEMVQVPELLEESLQAEEFVFQTGSLSSLSGKISTKGLLSTLDSGVFESASGSMEVSSIEFSFSEKQNLSVGMTPELFIEILEDMLYLGRELPEDVKEKILYFMTHNTNGDPLSRIDFSDTNYDKIYVKGALHIMLMQPEYIMQSYFSQSQGSPSNYDSFYDGDAKLVVVQAFGGLDWLHAMVPKNEYSLYAEDRGDGALTGSELLSLDENYYMNASLAPFKSLYDTGNLKIINRVGTPTHSRGHDSAMRKMTSQNNKYEFDDDGIIGGLIGNENPIKTVSLGMSNPLQFRKGNYLDIGTSAFFNGENTVSPEDKNKRIDLIKDIYLTRDFSSSAYNTFQSAVKVHDVAKKSADNGGQAGAGYSMKSNFTFAEELFDQNVSNVITMRADGGYDTHSNQKNTINKNLETISKEMTNFFNSVKDSQDITILFFSEFGRTLKLNSTDGTDHGMGGGMFLLTNNEDLKKRLKDGVYGNLSFANAESNWLGVAVDYRAVYSLIFKELYGKDISGELKGKYTLEDYMDTTPVDVSLFREEYQKVDANKSLVSLTFHIEDTNFHLAESSYVRFGYGTDPNALKEVPSYNLRQYETLADNGMKIKVGSSVVAGQTYYYELRIYDNQYNEKVITGSFTAPLVKSAGEYVVDTTIDTRFRGYENFMISGEKNLPNPIILSGTGNTEFVGSGVTLLAFSGTQIETISSPSEETIAWSGIFQLPKNIEKDIFISPSSSYSGTALEHAKFGKIIKVGGDKLGLSMKLNKQVTLKFSGMDSTKRYIILESEDGISWNVNTSSPIVQQDTLSFTTDHFSFFAAVEVDANGKIILENVSPEPDEPDDPDEPDVTPPSTGGHSGGYSLRNISAYLKRDICEYGDFSGDYYDGKCGIDPDSDIAMAMYNKPEDYSVSNKNDVTNKDMIGMISSYFTIPEKLPQVVKKGYEDHIVDISAKEYLEKMGEEMQQVIKKPEELTETEKIENIMQIQKSEQEKLTQEGIIEKIKASTTVSQGRKIRYILAVKNVFSRLSEQEILEMTENNKKALEKLIVDEIEISKKAPSKDNPIPKAQTLIERKDMVAVKIQAVNARKNLQKILPQLEQESDPIKKQELFRRKIEFLNIINAYNKREGVEKIIIAMTQNEISEVTPLQTTVQDTPQKESSQKTSTPLDIYSLSLEERREIVRQKIISVNSQRK